MVVDKLCPSKKIRVSNKHDKIKVWMKKLVQNPLKIIIMNCLSSTSNNPVHYDMHKKVHNRYTNCIRHLNLKKCYYTKGITENKGDSKGMWKV